MGKIFHSVTELIGRTPLRLFDMERAEPFLLKAGQKVVFKPITQEEYDAIERGETV